MSIKKKGSIKLICERCGKKHTVERFFYKSADVKNFEENGAKYYPYCTECLKEMKFEKDKKDNYNAEVKYGDFVKYVKEDKRLINSVYNGETKTMSVVTTIPVEDIITENKEAEAKRLVERKAEAKKQRMFDIIDSEDKKLNRALFIERAEEFNVGYIVEDDVIAVSREDLNALSKYDRAVFNDIIHVFEEADSNDEYIKFIAGKDIGTKVVTMKYADAKKSGFEKVKGTYSKEDNTVDVIAPADYEYKPTQYHEVEMLYKDYKSKYSQYKNKHNYSDRNGTITVYLPEGVEYVRSEKDEHYEELHAFKEDY